MAAPYSEWAFDPGQASPAQLVSKNDRAIDALVDGDHARGTYVNGSAGNLNPLNVYPVQRVDVNPDPLFFERSSEIVAYIAGDGGLIYEITGVYTELSLAEQKGNAIPQAETNSVAFLNGGFFYDDGGAGGLDLYDTDPPLRSLYAEIGVEANGVGGSFSVDIRDAGSVNHSLNDTKWHELYTEFFNHIVAAKEEGDAAALEIVAATNLAEIEAALAAMSPPNNTI